VFFFVDPSVRGLTGPRLIRLAEVWARERGARRLELIAPTERVGQLYERMSYEPIERSYSRVL
jgi:GNAT superfamily N-acetyltransferase